MSFEKLKSEWDEDISSDGLPALLLTKSTEPVSYILGGMKNAIKSEKINLVVLTAALLLMVFVILFKRSDFNINPLVSFYLLLFILAIVIYTFNNYITIKKVYSKIEGKELDSRETLVHTYYELKYISEKFKPNFFIHFAILVNIPIQLLKKETVLFFDYLFQWKNPFIIVPYWLPIVLFVLPILISIFLYKSNLATFNENFTKNLQAIKRVLDQFEA
jgi:hypothetical protein